MYFNIAHHHVFRPGKLTLGLMTPFTEAAGQMASLDDTIRLAALADALGFAALWTRDVPLAIPQGSAHISSTLDDPFLWLAALAHATEHIAVGAAAIVLPLRHPLHVAKASLTLDRLSSGRFILGLGSGDRPDEFASFGENLDTRRDSYRERWPLLRAALSPDAAQRQVLLDATGGHDLFALPSAQIPMLVVGSARQSLQWTAEHADGWATYHRPEARQKGRIGLWQQALGQKAAGSDKPFVQSVQLDLLADPTAPSEPLELGLRSGRQGLIRYLRSLQELGVAHVIFNLADNGRPEHEVLREIGTEIIPLF